MSYLFRDEYVLPSESHSSRSPFRWRNVQKQPTRNTAGEKRVRQEDVDSDYLFGSFSQLPAFRSVFAREILRRSPPSCQIQPHVSNGNSVVGAVRG